MFGYVTINKDELKIKDYNKYRAYYCGVCADLKSRFGRIGQMSLSYDMTFLAVLLTGLYEEDESPVQLSCAFHPLHKQTVYRNPYTAYAADMTIILSYYNQLDDWVDDRKKSAYVNARLLKRHYEKLIPLYPRQNDSLLTYIKELKECETQREPNSDIASGATGRLLGELFAYRDDIWAPGLRRLGFYLGKFIYLMDSYDDVERDIKRETYNPLVGLYQSPDFEDRCKSILTLMMAECSREFEKLPIINNADIIRNILYSGVWTKLEAIRKERSNAGSL